MRPKFGVAGYCTITEKGSRITPPLDEPTDSEKIAALTSALKELGVEIEFVVPFSGDTPSKPSGKIRVRPV